MLIYILYIALVFIGPLISGEIEEALEQNFPEVFRLVGAVILFVILLIIGIILYTRSPSTGTPKRPSPPGPNGIRSGSKSPAGGRAVNKFKPLESPTRGPTSPEKPRKTPVKKDIKKEYREEPKEEVIEFPKLVEGGIFGDTFIKINGGKVLKLRSQVVEPRYLK